MASAAGVWRGVQNDVYHHRIARLTIDREEQNVFSNCVHIERKLTVACEEVKEFFDGISRLYFIKVFIAVQLEPWLPCVRGVEL